MLYIIFNVDQFHYTWVIDKFEIIIKVQQYLYSFSSFDFHIFFGIKSAPIFRHTVSPCPDHNDVNSDQETNIVDCKRDTEDQLCPWDHGNIGVHGTSFGAY